MPFTIAVVLPPACSRADLLRALGIDDDDESARDAAFAPIELGRAATGATGLLSPVRSEPGRYVLEVPLLRAPWSGTDVLPAVSAAVASLGGRLDPQDAVDAWRRTRAMACHELAMLCASQGSPPPPFLPAADLDALHRWLIAIDEAPAGAPICRHVFCLDPQDGSPVRLAVRLPQATEAALVRVPPVGGVLADLAARSPESPLLFGLDALQAEPRDAHGFVVVDVKQARAMLSDMAGEALGRYRIVTPVEIIDAETLSA